MGYYCTVPQCTSLAGKTKNVKFHRFPRDLTMADKWNVILKRGKPYTKYSKVCSLHFTQADYNVTTMGQWKTLSRDAVPSQNLPKLNPDGSVMVIRKSRTVKYRDGKKEDSDKTDKSWQSTSAGHSAHPLINSSDSPMGGDLHDNSILAYRLQTLGAIANNISPQQPLSHNGIKPRKQDAFMQTDPVQNEDDDTQPNNSYSEVSEKSYSSEVEHYNQSYPKDGYTNPREPSPYNKEAQYPRESTPYSKETTPYSRESTPYKDATYTRDYKDSTYAKDSYGKESFQKESFQKDSYGKEPYQKDSYGKESFQKDSYGKESFQKDTYGKESFQKDTYGKESFQKDTYAKETSYKDAYNLKSYEPKDYTKTSEDYIPQTNEEYNKEAEKYALERKSHNGYDAKEYQKQVLENGYQKLPIPDMYSFDKYNRDSYYQNGYTDTVEVLQEQNRLSDNQNFFNENHIKQEIDINVDDDKFLYERRKEQLESDPMYAEQRRILEHIQQQVKQEPDTLNGCPTAAQPASSPYYPGGLPPAYYDPLPRPGPELLIAKQNALAAHTQLWQNTMKRPFFYSENPHYNGTQLLHRYDDIPRILQ